MGRVRKGIACSVVGCGSRAVRSLPYLKFMEASTGLEVCRSASVYLCRDHYRAFRRATRKVRMLEKWRRGPI